jgi:hypothetical protein
MKDQVAGRRSVRLASRIPACLHLDFELPVSGQVPIRDEIAPSLRKLRSILMYALSPRVLSPGLFPAKMLVMGNLTIYVPRAIRRR